jgi:hypothetical protein
MRQRRLIQSLANAQWLNGQKAGKPFLTLRSTVVGADIGGLTSLCGGNTKLKVVVHGSGSESSSLDNVARVGARKSVKGRST